MEINILGKKRQEKQGNKIAVVKLIKVCNAEKNFGLLIPKLGLLIQN